MRLRAMTDEDFERFDAEHPTASWLLRTAAIACVLSLLSYPCLWLSSWLFSKTILLILAFLFDASRR